MISNIMPFWMKYGWDRKNGGVYTCVDRDGPVDGYHQICFGSKGDLLLHVHMHIITLSVILEWLAAAKALSDFIEAHCFDTDGRMFWK